MEWSLPVDLQEEILSRVPAKSLARWKSTPKQWKGPISIEFLHLLRSTLKFPLLNLHLKSKSIYVTSFTAMVFCYAPPSTKDSRFGIHVQGKPSGLNLDTGTVSPTFRLSNKVVVCCKWRSDSINTIYFVGENKHVQVDQRRGDLTLGQSCSFLMNYVPSFVQIQQGTLLAPRT
ncbi:F17L21.28 [Arabidopsis thaliana]|uniref:Probable F-box protein At1g27490 n=1 Tax=Arabidopsis thaliana TaxID=3702 RepID=FB313_ARATH|nr:RecName: Full=Probable F-box protein At1g27490 [Arabidopsis thaliana]AAF99741.1 F17L21.28 [Arabidopsis thaliana]